MRSIVLHKTDSYTLTSYGNGVMYVLENDKGTSIAFQGDDALSFMSDLEEMEANYPNWEYEELLDMLWSDYYV